MEPVELRFAVSWTCPECDVVNFTSPLLDEEGMRVNPTQVTCPSCWNKYATVMGEEFTLIEDEDEDEEDDDETYNP